MDTGNELEILPRSFALPVAKLNRYLVASGNEWIVNFRCIWTAPA